MYLFDRVVSVSLSDRGVVVGEETELNVIFQVTKTSTSAQNTLNLKIYNLSDKTRQTIDENALVLTLSAGYSKDIGLQVLFSGNVSRVIHEFKSPDIITNLQCGDGLEVLKNQYINGSFAEGTTVREILNFVATSLDVPIYYNNVDTSEQFSQGYSLSSNAEDALTQVTRKAGATWSIQNGELQILKNNTSIENQMVLLSPESGLIESPELTTEDSYLLEGSSTDSVSLRVKSLLNPRISPGTMIRLESRQYSGDYTVTRVDHSGNNRGGDWLTIAEVEQL